MKQRTKRVLCLLVERAEFMLEEARGHLELLIEQGKEHEAIRQLREWVELGRQSMMIEELDAARYCLFLTLLKRA